METNGITVENGNVEAYSTGGVYAVGTWTTEDDIVTNVRIRINAELKTDKDDNTFYALNDVIVEDNDNIPTNCINIAGNINTSTSADAIHIGGDIYGSNGFILDGAMKDIKNTAILIQNTNNETYAIKA